MTSDLSQLEANCASIQNMLIIPQINLGRELVVYAYVTMDNETRGFVKDIIVKCFRFRLRSDAIHGDSKDANCSQKASFVGALRNGMIWYREKRKRR